MINLHRKNTTSSHPIGVGWFRESHRKEGIQTPLDTL